MIHERGVSPQVVGGLITALLLILLVSQARGTAGPTRLEAHFGQVAASQAAANQAAAAAAANQPPISMPNIDISKIVPTGVPSIPNLPFDIPIPGIGGSKPVGEVNTSKIKLVVESYAPDPEQPGSMKLAGKVINITEGTIEVPISAFVLRDSTGASYAAGGGATATLKQGEWTTLELSIPVPPDRPLTLTVEMQGDTKAELTIPAPVPGQR